MVISSFLVIHSFCGICLLFRRIDNKRGSTGRRRLQSSDSASVDGAPTTGSASGGSGGGGAASASGTEELGTVGMEWYSAETTGVAGSSGAVPVAPVMARVNPAVPGPPYVCNPAWPNFMTDLKTREKVRTILRFYFYKFFLISTRIILCDIHVLMLVLRCIHH